MRSWEVLLAEDVVEWFVDLTKNDPHSADLVEDAIDRLAAAGPTLDRPLVDRIKGSRHHNMKELRPGSAGTSEIRILFAFDPVRRVVLLVAGDKSGNWQHWYETAIPAADERYDLHLTEIARRDYR
ncbi:MULTISPECIES: type II toxin-antitoxin system RelE/ParE family toxin [Protofrankia]|uniref:Toxin RelE n=1 Tax=Protofrankia coriariae TaxID=1562887 RepID=A0ABR5F7U0_9ACTN|nr:MULTISPECIES: type II toxin-antitoxin system RelE/ParE family toxin [Protofrankia]KLL12750.1 toxin RelE [Protofrankia coriariae]ONH30930.1 addiction module toxin RelE [Protofrankia sp. BMG5.30]